MRAAGLIFSVFLWGALSPAWVQADEQEAIKQIESVGGTVRVIAQNTTDKEVAFHLADQDVTDEALAPLGQVADIVWLNLRGTKVTDAGLQHLAGLKSLTRLHLENTAVSDAGLAHLAGLENLEYLNLYGTKITDEGLKSLASLAKLKKLYVWQTEVTKQGADQLIASLPELYVNRGADAEPGPPTQTLARGRYVKIRLEGEKRILSLAEVQLLETASGAELQTSGTATQSSDYQNQAVAGRANDGNTDGVFEKGSVTHTNEENHPWWIVDLGEEKDIGKIVVHNRADCCGDRLSGAVIEVFDRSLAVVWSGKIDQAADGSTSEFVASGR